jgi:hypothetical protein
MFSVASLRTGTHPHNGERAPTAYGGGVCARTSCVLHPGGATPHPNSRRASRTPTPQVAWSPVAPASTTCALVALQVMCAGPPVELSWWLVLLGITPHKRGNVAPLVPGQVLGIFW